MDDGTRLARGAAQEAAWPHVLRVATATSLTGAAAAVALHGLAGVPALPLLGAAAVAALAVGSRLPSARPARRLPARSA